MDKKKLSALWKLQKIVLKITEDSMKFIIYMP